MQSRLAATLVLLSLTALGSAGTEPAHQAVGNVAVSFINSAPSNLGILARLSSSITEPTGLVLMGICLIGLSVVVRKRYAKKRSR